MLKLIGLFILILLMAIPGGFSWPFDKQEAKASEAPSEPRLNPSQEGLRSAPNKPEVLSPVPELPYLVKIPELPGAPPTPLAPPSLINSAQDTLDIQRQIEDIIKMNETLKSRYAEQAKEIQRISEQARIHQKILESVQQSRDTMDAVSREKIQIIKQETGKNQQYLEDLKKKGNSD